MYNRVILIGRLTADPELRTTPNGVNVCSFRLAVDRPYKKDGDKSADFLTVVAWRQQAEFVCRYFSKGRAIGIEGAIRTRDYTDKDSNKRVAVEVVAERVFFVESKNDADTRQSSESDTPSGQDDYTALDDDNDLPF